MSKIIISPSILAADFTNLNSEIKSIEEKADWLHIDIMDGHFVPNITFGPEVVKSIKTELFKDCHLMIENPEKYINKFISAGANGISVHIESSLDIKKDLQTIKEGGALAGLAIKPKTPISEVKPLIGEIDYLLIMSVEPGFGGQNFMPEILKKIEEAKSWKNNLIIQVDGGINNDTAKETLKYGANNLVAGSYIFNASNRAEAIKRLIINL